MRVEERGLLRSELLMGVVSGVAPDRISVNLSVASEPSAAQFETERYGRGEVGEFVLVEGQLGLVLGRLVEVKLPEGQRRQLSATFQPAPGDVIGIVQPLGSVRPDTLRVGPGVASYPRLGDRVYSAPHQFVSEIPERMESRSSKEPIRLDLGSVGGASGGRLRVRPERLFGRHCAVLGATGGGKSWTVARILEESARHPCKIVLLDATGEYRSLQSQHVQHVFLGANIHDDEPGDECSLPAACFHESDFVALFEPSGKVQGPRLRDAIETLRVVTRHSKLAGDDGCFAKAGQSKQAFIDAVKAMNEDGSFDDPTTPFDVKLLPRQLMHECVYPNPRNGTAMEWGGVDDAGRAYCLSLAARIDGVLKAPSFRPVFGSEAMTLDETLTAFLADGDARILRVSLAGISYEYRAREVMANVIGRSLLARARGMAFATQPLVVVVDEAHNFLGGQIGSEENAARLDAFEMIAREGRKYGLNLCLATQRPRDLTEGVLSQMGTMVVHRLTNHRDREMVERACGHVDRTASAFLPNLRPGEAALIGVDFPIPVTLQVRAPAAPPRSDGPRYQKAWASADNDASS